LRLTMLLYAGSLVGIYFGAIGTHIVKELYIRMVTAILILLCVISRVLAIPEYMIQMDLLSMEEGSAAMFELGSKIFLFGSGIVSTFLILLWTFRAKAKVNESKRLGFSHGHD
jgi:hypothetical protein